MDKPNDARGDHQADEGPRQCGNQRQQATRELVHATRVYLIHTPADMHPSCIHLR
jgi:hypothetical protein